MPGKRRLLPLAISGLLLIPTAQAAPKWDCLATRDGGWECLRDGVPVDTDAPAAAQTRPAEPTEPATETDGEQVTSETPAETTTPLTSTEPEPEITAAPTPTAISPAADEIAQSEPAADNAEPVPVPEPTVETTPSVSEPVPTVVTAPPATEPAAMPHERSSATLLSEEPRDPKSDDEALTSEPSDRTSPVATPPVASEKTPAVSAEPTAQPDTAIAATRIDQGLNWNQCGIQRGPLLIRGAPSTDDNTYIEADAADLYRNENRAEFAGNVVVERGDERLQADQATYARDLNTLDARGNAYLEQPGLRITGSRLHYNLGTRQGNAQQAEFRLTDSIARGSAATAELLNPDQSRYTDITYTTCPPGNSDWLVRAEELEIDQETGIGVARHAKLSFKGVPFLYTPYVSFPIDDRRKSGFLPPSIGTSETTGVDISIPYYFNIAPNLDATFVPRIMGKRGILLGGEFRYLTPRNSGVIQAELLPNDSGQDPGETTRRGSADVKLNGSPAANWLYDVDINYVSDNDYFDDLGTSLAVTSVKHQERRGDVRYYGAGWNFLGRVQQFQTIDDTIALNSRPYSRLPQLLLELEQPDRAYGLTYHLRSEYVQFDHRSDTKVKGDRLDLRPGLSLPLRRPWGFLTPKLSLEHTRYNLENQTPGQTASPSRTLPTFSLHGGVYFERPASWLGQSITQTLEPELFYLYTPYENQDAIPNFDTANLGFSFANLFQENRFSGADKVGDANQLTTALTSRSLSSESGAELFRASIGQIFYFRDREVQLSSSGAAADENSSSIVAEVAARLARNWRLQSGIQWDPHRSNGGRTEQSAVGLHYLDAEQRILNLTYRYTEGSIEQTDFAARWPINHQLHVVARWNYSLLHEKTMESFAGIEYNSCCWIARVVARDYRTSATTENEPALFLQLELKGLTSLGDKIDQFLERGILGYRTYTD